MTETARAIPAPGVILALDIATRTGWAASGGDGGVLDLSDDHNADYGRMGALIGDWLADRIVTLQPARVVIERPYIGNAPAQVYRLHGLVWTAHMVCWRHGIPRQEIMPSAWRKSIHGSGKLTTAEAKRRAKAWCAEHLGRRGLDDNEAEARCILAWAEGAA